MSAPRADGSAAGGVAQSAGRVGLQISPTPPQRGPLVSRRPLATHGRVRVRVTCCGGLESDMPKIRPVIGQQPVEPPPPKPAVLRQRGWAAGALLAWRWSPPCWLTAGISRAVYFIKTERHEMQAHAELRDLDGRRRVEIGSFATVETAKAGCERHAQALYRRDDGADRGPLSVAIAPVRPADRVEGRRIHRPTDPDEAQRWAAVRAAWEKTRNE